MLLRKRPSTTVGEVEEVWLNAPYRAGESSLGISNVATSVPIVASGHRQKGPHGNRSKQPNCEDNR